MMKFIRKYYPLFLFFLTGLILGFFISRLPLEFEPKTNWVSLASFFLTIALAIYLEFVVRPSFSNNRIEKDLIINQLKEIRTKIDELNTIYVTAREASLLSQEIKYDIVQRFRFISNQIDFLQQTIELCELSNGSNLSSLVFQPYAGYKRQLTGFGFDKPNFFYDRLHWIKHEKSYKKFIKATMQAIILVNKQ
jgi:hypothetical protein